MSLVRSLLLAPLLPLPLAAQGTIHVPADVGTIQGAIQLAQDGDTVLVAPGTYLEVIDFLGKAITVASEGGATITTIDAQGFNPVVAFLSDEGQDSVLRGFTVTGGVANGNGAGVECTLAARPRIESCVERANRSRAGSGGGIFGSPILEDCRIEDNQAFAGGGAGVFGSPVLRRCIVQRNAAYEGAGLQLLGGRVEDTQVLDNLSDEGSGGGAVSILGPGVVLLRCTIARNHQETRGLYSTRGSGVYVAAGLSPVVASCTIVANVVDTPVSQFACPRCKDVGGVFGPARLVNTILRDNDAREFSVDVTAIYSNIQGSYPTFLFPGVGNFNADALFRDAAGGDYRLLPGSPCIDTGAPVAPLDPDGSPSDVGALAFTHAVAFERNGTGVNPQILASATAPIIGSAWVARVDPASIPATRLTGIVIKSAALDPGLLTPAGELLIAGTRLGLAQRSYGGHPDDYPFDLPGDPALLGLEVHAQAFAVTLANGSVLGNALRLLLGE